MERQQLASECKGSIGNFVTLNTRSVRASWASCAVRTSRASRTCIALRTCRTSGKVIELGLDRRKRGVNAR